MNLNSSTWCEVSLTAWPARPKCCDGASISGRRDGRGLRFPALAVLVLATLPQTALKQSAGQASPFLPLDHWSYASLAHLQGAGLLEEGFDPGATTLSRLEAFERLEYAAAAADERAPGWVALAGAYRDRFEEEFPSTAARASGASSSFVSEGALVAGLEARKNGLLAKHLMDDGSGFQTLAVRDVAQPVGALEFGALLPPKSVSIAAYGALLLPADRVTASEVYGMLRVGRVGLWTGRRRLGFGSADGGSVILNSQLPIDGVGLFLADAVRLPGFLHHLGAFRAETVVSRLDHAGEVRSPWLFGFRTSLTPHPRFRVGLNRAALFGGGHSLVPPVTFGRVVKVMTAVDTEEEGQKNFEDQIGSLDVWFAPPLGSFPLVVYGEWGVQDLSAQREMPALVGGMEVVGIPGAPWLSVGLEHTVFKQPKRGSRSWYDHRVFGTWTDDGNLLGHGLGGEGRELRVFGAADLLEARLGLEVRGFSRDRGEGNLFAPEREGSSSGFAGAARWRLTPTVELEASGALESGTGWRESAGFLGVRFIF